MAKLGNKKVKYHYTSSQLDGRLVEGDLEAENESGVLDFLASKGLRPITIRKIGEFGSATRVRLFSAGINATDKIFLTKYLALMLRVGTDLLKALDILIADFEKPAMKALLLEIKLTLSKGQPFYITFEKYPRLFSPVFVNLIKAGEVSGNLEMIFENLNIMLEKEQDLKRKIKAALVYPIMLLCASTMVLIFLVVFALPKIAELFSSGGFKPPLFSRVVFAIGLFVGKHVVVLLSAFAAFIILNIFFFVKTQIGRRLFSAFLSKTPVVRGVVQKVAIQRFSTTLSALMMAGLPIIDTLNITAGALGNEKMSNALRRIAQEGVARGLTLGDAFKKETDFPLVLTNLIAVSEKAGHLDEILKTLADFYESEIDASLKILVSFIEPVMLMFIGLVIGLIALSIIVPIYQLVGTVQ